MKVKKIFGKKLNTINRKVIFIDVNVSAMKII